MKTKKARRGAEGPSNATIRGRAAALMLLLVLLMAAAVEGFLSFLLEIQRARSAKPTFLSSGSSAEKSTPEAKAKKRLSSKLKREKKGESEKRTEREREKQIEKKLA